MSETRKSKLKLRRKVNVAATVVPTSVPMVSVINALVQNTVNTSSKAEVMVTQPDIVAGNPVLVDTLKGTIDAKVRVQDVETYVLTLADSEFQQVYHLYLW
jgi:hypothetical protein